MARGVETVSILGAGVLLTVGLMVFADWRTNTSTSTEGMPISLEEQPLSEKAFAASVEAEKEPLPLASAQPPIAKMEATDPEQAPAALAPAIASARLQGLRSMGTGRPCARPARRGTRVAALASPVRLLHPGPLVDAAADSS